MFESRDIIRNRMMRHISRLWGYPGIESEEAFDPILGMMIGACANELEKISKEIVFSQTRVIENVARLFVPEAEIRAIPAHTVLHIPASNIEDTIDSNTALIASKTIETEPGSAKFEEKSMVFVPCRPTKIHNAEIKYLITNDYIYKQMEGKYKDVFAPAINKKLTDTCFYIGIASSSSKPNLEALSIFFELDEKTENKELFFDNFKYARFSINGKQVKAWSGFSHEKRKQQFIDKIIANQNLFTKKIGDINDYYAPQFINIESINNIEDKFRKCPEELTDVFDTELIDAVDDNIIWLKIEFPSIISYSTLAHLSCHLNCFPAVNCKAKKETMNLQEQLNIKALTCDNYFYDVHKVEDNAGNTYGLSSLLQENNNGQAEETSYEYIIRTTGVGRLDQRSAAEMLQDLINAIKEDSVAFSMYNNANLLWHSQEIKKQLLALENIVSGKPKGESITYIMLNGNSNDQNRHLTVDYWETAGQFANNIKRGSSLKITGSSSFAGKNATLMVRTHGGRGYLSGEEKLQAFKKSYVSKNRIVTLKDVEHTVEAIMGNRAESVKVFKSVEPGLDKKHGFTRVVQVIIEANPHYLPDDREEKDALAALLQKQLESDSAAVLNFRVQVI